MPDGTYRDRTGERLVAAPPMKVAVVNYSGNVGKSIVAQHVLLPRIRNAELFSLSGGHRPSRGRRYSRPQCGEMLERLSMTSSAVVDVDADQADEYLAAMKRYAGSHEDIDCFVVPTTPGLQQQRDTMQTLLALAALGVRRDRVKLLFNEWFQVCTDPDSFDLILDDSATGTLVQAEPVSRLRWIGVFSALESTDVDLAALTQRLGNARDAWASADKHGGDLLDRSRDLLHWWLAREALHQFDGCFDALELPVCRQ
ncbi:hypothetical protein CKO44_06210 [Rubrivivax gelatinosus]|nr:hypothetical protein [Rubrivivax gelatinosus]